MTVLDWIAIALLVLIAVIAVAVLVFLGGWPGRVARALHHPHEKAVSIGGWVTLLAGGLFYPIVLIWAYAGGSPERPQLTKEVDQG